MYVATEVRTHASRNKRVNTALPGADMPNHKAELVTASRGCSKLPLNSFLVFIAGKATGSTSRIMFKH